MPHGRLPQRLSAIGRDVMGLGGLKPAPGEEFTPLPQAIADRPDLESAGLAGLGSTELLALILGELRGNNQRDETFPLNIGLADTADYAQGSIALDTALVDKQIRVHSAYKITFTKIPKAICEFTVRLRTPDAKPIDVRAAGNQITSSNTIHQIFVTTNPAIPAGTIEYIAGEVEARQVAPIIDPNHLVFEHDETESYSNIAIVNAAKKCALYDHIDKADSTGQQSKFQGIPERWAQRVWGVVAALKPSSTSIGEFRVIVKTGGTTKRRIINQLIPESGSLIFRFDSGWYSHSTLTNVLTDTIDLGVAGNEIWYWLNLAVVSI